MTVTQDLAAELAEALVAVPAFKRGRVLATEKLIDPPRVPTVVLRQTSIGRCPELPNSHRNVGVLLSVVSHLDDLDNAGPAMTDLVEAILDYLDPRYVHEDAEARGYNKRLAYDIPMTVIAQKD